MILQSYEQLIDEAQKLLIFDFANKSYYFFFVVHNSALLSKKENLSRKEKKMNIACYVRVSTEEQKKFGISVDNQIQALTDYCKDNNAVCVGIYNDAGISAAKSYAKRPALLRLMQDCKKGKVDLIIFTRIDRWFRSVKDYYKVQEQLDECGVHWKAIWEDYETETSSGRFKVNIMLSIAEAEAARTSEKIKSVFEYKKVKGEYVGKAPLGYLKQNNALIKDEAVKPGIEIFFRTYLKTFSTAKSVQAAHEAGYDFSAHTMKHVAKNPIYYGECKNGYKVEPYITREQFDKIQEFKERRTRTTTHGDVFLFSQLIFCGNCGRAMAARRKYFYLKTGEKHYYTIYTCERKNDYRNPCVNLCINQDRIEKYLLKSLDELIDIEIENVKLKKQSASVQNPIARKNNLESKLKRLADLYAEGDITLAAYKEKRDLIKKEISTLRFETEAETIVKLPEGWRNIYNDLTPENKHAFWLKIINKIIVTNDTKDNPEVIFNFPFTDL